MTDILDYGVDDFLSSLALPPPAATLSSSTAFASPTHQPGLVLAPPSAGEWVLPSRPPSLLSSRQASRRPYAAIPASAHGSLDCPLPIITTDPSADAIHANGKPNRGYKHSFATYPEAVSHILTHFAHHGFPAGICHNCFTYHGDSPCASPPYDWTSRLGPHHPRCQTCQTFHFPPCHPYTPSSQ